MPRILHLLNSLEIGGKERAALRLARRAKAEGLSAELVLFDSPYRSENLDFDPTGVPWKFMKRGRGLDLSFIKKFAEYCAVQSIDVVHAHNDTAHVYAGLAARYMRHNRVRVVTTLHTRPHHGGSLARLLTRNAARARSNVYAVSEQLAEEVVGAGWIKACGVILNGVDLCDFAPTGRVWDIHANLKIPDSHIVLGHIARFDPIKKHEDLLIALHLLQTSGCPVTVVCVGQGPLLERIKELGHSLANLRFMNAFHDIPSLVRSLDGVILCSQHEATPLALLEGMACGKPVIATAVGGMPALLGDIAGILVPPGQPDKLAEAIKRLSQDAALRNELSKRSRERALLFSFDREWAAYCKAYQESAEDFRDCTG